MIRPILMFCDRHGEAMVMLRDAFGLAMRILGVVLALAAVCALPVFFGAD